MEKTWSKNEILILAVAWVLIYASDPLYMFYATLVKQFDFQWDTILYMWRFTTAYFILFLIHHFVLVPKLFAKKRTMGYLASVAMCIASFTCILVLSGNPHEDRPQEPLSIQIHTTGTHKPQHIVEKPHRDQVPFLSPPDLARLVIALMMLGLDVCGAAWINDQKMRQRLLQLEKQNLKQELDHLRYQINPHFFMNTLNNIHALVDIDQERAKRAIIELSGLMRYSLYSGNDSVVPVLHEVDFLKQYISLMKLRFGNKVKVEYNLPDSSPADACIPPLLLATFVENAFKHGISYQSPSFITISLTIDNNLIHFACENSRHIHVPTTQDGHHGIGLVNVKKRLDLQYSDTYSLQINDQQTDRFTVTLTLPKTLSRPLPFKARSSYT